MRIDRSIFGYVTFSVEPEYIKKAATALISADLSARFYESGKFKVSIFALKKYEKALSGIPYTKGEVKGFLGFILKNKKRYGAILGMAVLLLYFIFVYDLIWDIRVEGSDDIPAALVLEELSSTGFDIGSKWHNFSRSEIERTLLENSDKIGWVNINRRGNVAYVTVKGKSNENEEEKAQVYSNVVASEDCIIEEITVKHGIACVKAGDSVKKGQLLISGIIPGELGGGFVRAEGEILGRVSEDISVFVPSTEDVITYGNEELSESHLKIFGFSINIFKSYGKKYETCAIIEEKEECVLFGCRLPIGIYRTYKQEIQSETEQRSDDELVKIAAYRLIQLRAIKLSDAELLRMNTYGEFKDGGYEMHSFVTVLKNIGEEFVFYQ